MEMEKEFEQIDKAGNWAAIYQVRSRGPLGRAVSPTLGAQGTPVARPRRPRPRLGLAALATPPLACVSPRSVSSPSPPNPTPTWPSHPLSPLVTPLPLPCLDRTTSGPLPLSPGEEGGLADTPRPRTFHFLRPEGVRSWRPRDDSPLTPFCPFIC